MRWSRRWSTSRVSPWVASSAAAPRTEKKGDVMRRCTAVLIVLATGGFATVGAQDSLREPSSGTVALAARFVPNPFTIAILAGGAEDLDWLGHFGTVADAPNLSLVYEAGVLPLTIYIESAETDTVLLINDPNGAWHYNDDTIGMHPAITFLQPESGRYDIWIGTFLHDSAVDSILAIAEEAP